MVHCEEIEPYLRRRYRLSDLERLERFLVERGVLAFRPLATGLYPAAQVEAANGGGYHNAWVRDNVYVAHAHWLNGRTREAVRVAEALAAFFAKHRVRFDRIVAGAVDRTAPMNRVHVRFDGNTLKELPERWSHAQNDALGYFVWLFCNLAAAGALAVADDGLRLMETFLAYLAAIRFWEDEDSGHWEENRKISASSIGVVVGGLESLRTMLGTPAVRGRFEPARLARTESAVVDLIGRGRDALDGILPAECVQPDPKKLRRYDAALLFLISPMNVVGDAMASRIVGDVETHLRGAFGVRRYVGDSYWCADYRKLYSPETRSADFSDHLDERDRLLRPGEEAQWCIFDPILSVVYGERAMRTGAAADVGKQIDHFNRSLGQITSGLRCPEAYALERGRYVPNDDTPLLWTAANLWLALHAMKAAAG